MIRPTSRAVPSPSQQIAKLLLLQHGLPSRICARNASFSAIHRGIRRSEKVQFGETRRPRAPGRDSAQTAKSLAGTASSRQQYKLKKKLDRKAAEKEAEREDGTGRQTRRKRFLDPESSFGKKSLVYQLRHGSLKDKASGLELQQHETATGFRDYNLHPQQPRDNSFFRGQGNAHSDRSRDTRVMRETYRDEESRGGRERTLGGARRAPLDWEKFDDKGPVATRDGRGGRQSRFGARDRDRDSPRDRISRRSTDPTADDDAGFQATRQRKPMKPMTIKYTTAASQFLYGKSVVTAALEQGRRALYQLYIYGGESRKDAKDKENAAMIRLAEKRRVRVTIVPQEDQRLMDKMSMGRPHNGFVLETSPLPQLPITSLGAVEEGPQGTGFQVVLDHQSKEEQVVNGTDTFVPRSNGSARKPFVMLLNEILDPGNLGALLRTANYLGVDAVAITNRSTSKLTPVVLKSAAGAAEEVTIFTVDSPEDFLEKSRTAGWKSYAAVAPPNQKLVRMHGDKFVSMDDVAQSNPLVEHPCVLVLGNEGHGLSRQMKLAADYELSVPRYARGSSVDSLNVSVAAGLLCHAFVKHPSSHDALEEAHDAEAIETHTIQEKVETYKDGAAEVEESGNKLF